MALLRSLLTGVSGLRAQQTAIDITGDNIANVSTVGFKGSRANFSTMISQNLRFGQAPSGFLGGTNPSQVGLGVQVAEVQKLMTQGALRQTGLATDLAIDDGQNARTFFVMKDYTGNNVYTRDGTFGLNRENFLFDPGSGYKVQGWMADTNTQVVGPSGAIDFSLNTGGQLVDIQIELGNLVIAKETTFTDWRGNLNGGGGIADQASVLESEALFDASSGVLVAASDSTLLQNLARSSTGDNKGNAIDLNMEVGSKITLDANIGGTVVKREFIVGDPPPTGGMTLGDLRDWMQGAMGIDENSTNGNEMISAQRIDATSGEAVNGTLDQVGSNGFLSLTLGGANYQSFSGATGLANQNAPLSVMLDMTNAGGTAIATALTVNVVGTGAANLVTSADMQNALNAAAATQNLPAQFNVTGSFTNGFRVTNTAGNGFNINGGDTALVLGADPAASVVAPTLGTSQQSLLQAGDTVTFDNFQPLMAAQTMTVVPSGTGNGANQFELGDSVAQTAANLATAININPVMSGLVTASVVGNQIQLSAKNPGMDGNFTVQTTSINVAALTPSTVGVDTTNAVVGDTMTVTADGNPVTSTLSSRIDPAVFPSVLPNGLTGTAGDATVEIQLRLANMPNSPITLSVSDAVAYATPTDFINAVIAAIDADANIITAGLNGTFSATVDNVTGNFSITNSSNADFSFSADAADADDFGRVFTTAATSSSNGVKIQMIPAGGTAAVGFTGVVIGATPSGTARNVAAAINSSIYTNPPMGASSLGAFVRITDESSIEAGQGNAVSAGNIVLAPSQGFSLEIGNTMIGAGASADTFIQPDPTDFANGAAIGTMIDDETNFLAAGVQVGDFIRFSTGPAAGLIAKIVQVGQIENPSVPGTLLSNPHAIRFELQATDIMPSATVPSAYTIHEAAQVDIGVNSNLAASNPPNGLDTASGAGQLRVSGHVGSANRINSLELNVRNANGTTNLVAGFSALSEAEGESIRTTTTMYDSLGIARKVDVTYWLESKSNGGTRWRWQATSPDNNVTPGTEVQTVVGSGTVNFDTRGRYISDSGDQIRLKLDDYGVDEPMIASLNFSKLTGFAADVSPDGSVSNPTSVFLFNQDGFKAGTLDDFNIGTDGKITGFFNNGLTRSLGQIATARFANPAGLASTGENYFREDVNSGRALIGPAGSAGRGIIRSGFLEESNVELAEQFTDLITAQRAYQANARTITTSSQLLQELVNLV